MKKGLVFLGCVAVVAAVYLAGPRLEREEVDRVLPVVACEDVEGYVREREAALPVKPGNESVVVWADSAGRRTEWVLGGFGREEDGVGVVVPAWVFGEPV